MKDFRYLEDVATLALDEQKCIGCGLCIEVCPHAVFEMQEKNPGSLISTPAWNAGPVSTTVRQMPYPSAPGWGEPPILSRSG